jgi:glycerol kinase
MTQFTTKEHLCRATLEAIAYQTKDIMDSMSTDTGTPVTLLRVDGGMAMSSQMMQIQADIAGVELIRPAMLETTAFGAALAAGHAVGVWKHLEELHSEDAITRFVPNISADKRAAMHSGWKKALEKSMGWVE